MLDAASVRPDTILLLDTFFHVVIFHGETIGAWREQGYQVSEERQNTRGVGGLRSGALLFFFFLTKRTSFFCISVGSLGYTKNGTLHIGIAA